MIEDIEGLRLSWCHSLGETQANPFALYESITENCNYNSRFGDTSKTFINPLRERMMNMEQFLDSSIFPRLLTFNSISCHFPCFDCLYYFKVDFSAVITLKLSSLSKEMFILAKVFECFFLLFKCFVLFCFSQFLLRFVVLTFWHKKVTS